MKNLILLGLAFSLALFSCNNDDDAEGPIVLPPVVEEPVFLPLTEGNYWIYENVLVEPDGTETLLDPIDSIYVAGDTLVNGITHTIFRGTKHLFGQEDRIIKIVRESSGDLLNIDDNTIFSSTNFTDILNIQNIPKEENPSARIEYKMEEIDGEVTVPAGTFNDVLNYTGKLIALTPTEADSIRYLDNFYAKDLGVIFETAYFFGSNNVFEKRLIRFSIQ